MDLSQAAENSIRDTAGFASPLEPAPLAVESQDVRVKGWSSPRGLSFQLRPLNRPCKAFHSHSLPSG